MHIGIEIEIMHFKNGPVKYYRATYKDDCTSINFKWTTCKQTAINDMLDIINSEVYDEE